MITCVCGMIASGKSTWCEKQGGIISDYDLIKNKDEQIRYTINCDEKGGTVYHITCYPTPKEKEVFEGRNLKYIWINTGWEQCRKNILARKRLRDTQNIKSILKANAEIYKKYQHSNIQFWVVDVFPTGEKW